MTFREAYSSLNKAQKEAVDSIEGPVLVIAGPGTGKTQLLSVRVANILKNSDAIEDNILCLTFTETAVNEMSVRLSEIIGPSSSKITISTYHGFGSNLIKQYPQYFGTAASLEPADDLLIHKTISDIIDKLSVKNPFKHHGQIKNIKSLIGDLKQAAVYPDDLKKIIKLNLDFIKNSSVVTKKLSPSLQVVSKKSADTFSKLLVPERDTKTSKIVESMESIWNRELKSALEQAAAENNTKPLTAWKKKFLAKDENNLFIPSGQDKNERLSYFNEVYEMYLASMENQSRYDYDDMILKSIEALKSHPELKYTLQEQYQYILLDEYQDTNEAQAELVSLLCDSPINEGRPNVMAVGDDDQAIYAFQGASHSHMLDFCSSYKDVKLVTLDINYRSTKQIIDLSQSIGKQIESRLSNQISEIKKNFKPFRQGKSKIRRLDFADQANEYFWISKNIKESAKGKYSKIAILAPQHKYLTKLATYLQAENIPITYERRDNILEDPLILQILTICKLLVAIKENAPSKANYLLSVVLYYDFWNIDTEEIWKLSLEAYSKKSDWLSLMLKNKTFKQMALFLIKLSSDCLEQRYDSVLDHILGLSEVKTSKQSGSYKSPFYDSIKDNQGLMLKTLSSLSILRDKFEDYKLNHKGPLLLPDLLDFIDTYNDTGLNMVNASPYTESSESVLLTTTYKAKGMEFDTVYMLSAIDNVWGAKTKKNNSKISLPMNLEFARRSALDSDDERLRLIYVTLSRAKNDLYLTGYKETDSSKETTPLSYIATDQISTETVDLNKKLLKEVAGNMESYYTSNYRSLIDKPDMQEYVRNILQSYKLSPSDFNAFLDVMRAGPMAFYHQRILKHPSPSSKELSYGTAIHGTLDFIQKSLSANKKLPTEKQILDEFIKDLQKHHLSNNDYKASLEQGTLALKKYLKENKAKLSPADISEVRFQNEGVVINKAPLVGVIDKISIDKANKKLSIVDYKTGSPHKSWTSEVPIRLNQNQLYFYILLANNSKTYKRYSVSDSSLHFISYRDSSPDILTLNYSVKRQKEIEQLIGIVWQHIKDLNFPDVSAYSQDFSGVVKFEQDLLNGKI